MLIVVGYANNMYMYKNTKETVTLAENKCICNHGNRQRASYMLAEPFK